VFTKPDGSPITIDCSQVQQVRMPLFEQFSQTVQSIITVGGTDQRVRESEEIVRQMVLSHGGHV